MTAVVEARCPRCRKDVIGDRATAFSRFCVAFDKTPAKQMHDYEQRLTLAFMTILKDTHLACTRDEVEALIEAKKDFEEREKGAREILREQMPSLPKDREDKLIDVAYRARLNEALCKLTAPEPC